MTTKTISRLLFYAGTFLSTSISSCNSNTSTDDDSLPGKVSQRIVEEFAQLDTIEITINSNDKMQFDKDEIVVRDGQTVALILNHTGKMPKSAMGHNFVLINNVISISDYAKLAIKAKNTEYIPVDEGLTLAHTHMIGGGESTSTTFKAPKVGTYDFICSFPGHYSIMNGKFIVK